MPLRRLLSSAAAEATGVAVPEEVDPVLGVEAELTEGAVQLEPSPLLVSPLTMLLPASEPPPSRVWGDACR